MDTKNAATELQTQHVSTHDSAPRIRPEDAAIEELGHKATLPRTLSTRLGVIGTMTSVVCPWPAALAVAPLCLPDGGSGGYLIGFVVSAVFMTLVYYLIAEKLLITPTAGGQYHMVLKLAPEKYQRFLSYICGFVLHFTWESYLTSGSWLFGLNLSAIITIWTGRYEVYYAFVPTVIVLVFACVVNLNWDKYVDPLEATMIAVQAVAFVVVLVILALAVASHRLTPRFTFETETGWPNWVGALLSLCYCTGVLGGFDCATHLAEDTENPRSEIPNGLMLSTTVNSFFCIIVAVLVTLCAADPNLFTGELALSGHPFGTILQLFVDATGGNKNAAYSVFALSAVIAAVCAVNTTATSSRMLFSLVRDGRDPVVTKLLAKDLGNNGLPRICIVIVDMLPLVILWINFVSSVGYQAIVSQVTMALTISYFLVIACSLDARINRPELLGSSCRGFWQPGSQLGILMDVIAMIFLLVIAILCCLPYAPHPDVVGWNYAPFIVLAVVLIGIALWFISARKFYRPGKGTAV